MCVCVAIYVCIYAPPVSMTQENLQPSHKHPHMNKINLVLSTLSFPDNLSFYSSFRPTCEQAASLSTYIYSLSLSHTHTQTLWPSPLTCPLRHPWIWVVPRPPHPQSLLTKSIWPTGPVTTRTSLHHVKTQTCCHLRNVTVNFLLLLD